MNAQDMQRTLELTESGQQITIRFKATENQHDAFSWLRSLYDLGLRSDKNRRMRVVAVSHTDWASKDEERTVLLTVGEAFSSTRMPNERLFSKLEYLAVVFPAL